MSFQIDGKEVIVLGDMTTHGGKVISASSDLESHGIKVARVGDMVACPRCKGSFPIVEGAPFALDLKSKIARHGDKVACGASLISRGGGADTQGGFLDWFGSFFSDDDDGPFPGRGLPEAEYCKVAKKLKESKEVKEALKRMGELTDKNKVEYSCWFVENSDGTIRVENFKTDNDTYSVRPGPKPEGAIGQVHSHVYSAPFPSEQDYYFFNSKPVEERPMVYIITDTSGEPFFLNDEGADLACD